MQRVDDAPVPGGRERDGHDDDGFEPPRACGYREPDDDFFCLRFQVWYASRDCAIRTKFRTCEGCLDCEQGRFNLKRHAVALRGFRWPPASGD